MKERILMPALQPCIIEPIWEQFSTLLPDREVEHPRRSGLLEKVLMTFSACCL